MAKRASIKLEALHIDGEDNDLWFHGMNTLGHDQVFTYEEFTWRLAKIFDRRDPDIAFRELAHIRQVGTPKAYIS